MENDTKILVADDDAEFRDLVTGYLAGEGYTVIEASNGCEAYDIAVNEDPDVLLLDIAMPLRSGFEVCRALKVESIESKKCKVVMLSAKISFNDRLNGYLSGASRYICKPCDLDDIGECIEVVLKQRNIRHSKINGVGLGN